MYQAFNVLIQSNLNSEAYYQANNKIPKVSELTLSKTPTGNQCEHCKINSKQDRACNDSVQSWFCDVVSHGYFVIKTVGSFSNCCLQWSEQNEYLMRS